MDAQEKVDQFVSWAVDNPDAILAMYTRAKQYATERGYVSANYLLEWLRYDSKVKIHTPDGYVYDYKAPNTFATIFGRYLAKDPAIRPCIQLNRSEYDLCYLPPIPYIGSAA